MKSAWRSLNEGTRTYSMLSPFEILHFSASADHERKKVELFSQIKAALECESL